MDDLFLQFRNIAVVHFLADHFIEPGFLCFFPVHRLYRIIICHGLYLIHDALVVRRSNLGAVFPVHFVAIVFRRVMAGRNVDAGDRSQPADCIRKFRRRAQRFENVRLDPVCRQAARRFIGKFRGHPAGIVGNRHAFRLPVIFYDIICKSLCGLPYRIYIHPVRSCSDHASKTCCSKLQLFVKTLFYFVVIIRYTPKLFFRGIVEIGIFQPFFITFAIFHFRYLLSLMTLLYNRSL